MEPTDVPNPCQLGGGWCESCGQPLGAGCPTDGRCRGRYDPPRFCPTCGRRLSVVVTPASWRATCRSCATSCSS